MAGARHKILVFSLVLIAFLLGTCMLILVNIVGSFERRSAPVIVVGEPVTPDSEVERGVVFCLPVTEQETGTQFVAVAVVDKSQPTQETFLASGSKGAQQFSPECVLGESSWRSSVSIQNVVVRSADGGDQRLLFEQPVMIKRFARPSDDCENGSGIAPCDFLYWEIRERDNNSDGTIDSRDAVVAYLSSLHGTDFARVSPANSHLVAVTRDRGSMILQVQFDTDSDGVFGPRDKVELLEYEASTSDPATSLMDPNIIAQARQLLE